MSSYTKQFHIVAGMPVLKPSILQGTIGDFETLAKEGKESIPLLARILQTAIGRYKCKYEVGPGKSKQRFNVKAVERGYQSPRENSDFCRAFIYVTSADQIIKLANFFRPSNNSNVVLFEDSFAVPKESTDLRRLQIKIRLPNGHVAEIQVRHANMKKAFDDSHDAYEREAAVKKRYPDPESRPQEAQKKIDHYRQKRYDANHLGANRLPSLNKLIHQRNFYLVGDTPVMVVSEPFTNERYAVIPRMTDQGPMYMKDNSFMTPIKKGDPNVYQTNRDTFVVQSLAMAKKAVGKPALEVVAA